MTLLGLKLGDLLKVFLEWITTTRRHRKELAAREDLGATKKVSELQTKERQHVQDASAADDQLPTDAESVRKDPNNEWSPD